MCYSVGEACQNVVELVKSNHTDLSNSVQTHSNFVKVSLHNETTRVKYEKKCDIFISNSVIITLLSDICLVGIISILQHFHLKSSRALLIDTILDSNVDRLSSIIENVVSRELQTNHWDFISKLRHPVYILKAQIFILKGELREGLNFCK